MSRCHPSEGKSISSSLEEGAIPTDTVSSFQTRRSLHHRRSLDMMGNRRQSLYEPDYDGDSQRGLMRSFDEEQSYELPETNNGYQRELTISKNRVPANDKVKRKNRSTGTITEDPTGS